MCVERNSPVILGASHITLGCDDLDASAASLRDYGYVPEFIDRNVINHASKQPILAEPCAIHGIGLLRSEKGFPIELVSYRDEMPNSFGRYIGVFETTRPIRAAVEPDFGVSFSGISPDVASEWVAGAIDDLGAPAFFVRTAQMDAGLQQVVLPVDNVERARQLWCDILGFATISASNVSAELQFISPVPAWRIRLVLAAAQLPKVRSTLDARGMACLSLLSSNVASDVSRMVAGGAQLLTDIFDIPINGRNLKVAILTDLDGAFVELLQVAR